ncbi:MXAN_6230/SCO0854 family RING domain-containing protein [Massilia sp. W12]|uniref:MXAN_6230/SCO0854 family RING domain-containing protein n=1 Tax=Massilia sp. W12 TaxID=3126507 RepID=UPI0030CE91DF
MFSAVHRLLLERHSILCLPFPASEQAQPAAWLQALDLEWAALGFVANAALRARLARLSAEDLRATQEFVSARLAWITGAAQRHRPLFQNFPHGLENPDAMWTQRFLSHFFQDPDQPCLFCCRHGSTHVLSPCRHVVCGHCYDGREYAGCPVCGARVDTESAFFQPPAARPPGQARPILKLIYPGELQDEAQDMFLRLCARTQVMTPLDVEDLQILSQSLGEDWASRLPPAIPVRENVAHVFGALLKKFPPQEVLTQARSYQVSVTDILRLIAAYCGADPALMPQLQWRRINDPRGLEGEHGRSFLRRSNDYLRSYVQRNKVLPYRIQRFHVAKMGRPLRRALLAALESFPAQAMLEDMQRQRSLWVWLGEFLHPHEYAARYPNTAQGFASVRRRSPQGARAPKVRSWASRVEQARAQADLAQLLHLLRQRPGEFGRRLDHILRSAAPPQQEQIMQACQELLPALPTPMLLTLLAHLPARSHTQALRLYWPKGGQARCFSAPDQRALLPLPILQRMQSMLETCLLQRMAGAAPIQHMVLDRSLEQIATPFNQRTAARDAWQLPRGASLSLPMQGVLRLFLYWRQHQGQERADLDLSVAFYDSDWQYQGVCSYYDMVCVLQGRRIAHSAGDLTSAPWPQGASEFVDVNLPLAYALGVRYAVMVVNNYAGPPFEALESAYAGVMLRQDADGELFDPRSVATRFALSGGNGVFLPVVFDFFEARMHWLDVHAQGQFSMNNVENSKDSIAKICPDMMRYFALGVRPTMWQIGLLHAAARAQHVCVREGLGMRLYQRAEGEDAASFLQRLRAGGGEWRSDFPFAGQAVHGVLDHGDLNLAPQSKVWVMRPQTLVGNMTAADCLSMSLL